MEILPALIRLPQGQTIVDLVTMTIGMMYRRLILMPDRLRLSQLLTTPTEKGSQRFREKGKCLKVIGVVLVVEMRLTNCRSNLGTRKT